MNTISEEQFAIWKEETRKILYDRALMDYNEVYYRTVFCPEKELPHAKLILEKFRRNWFDS